MDRLTIYEGKYGHEVCYYCKGATHYIVPYDRMHETEIRCVLQRLYLYEETGLSPKEVEEMKQEMERRNDEI